MALITKLRESMPNETLHRIFTEIVETVHEQFRLEDEYHLCETTLLNMENEVRVFAKKDNTDPHSFLSTKLLTLRKDVESQRI